MKQSMLRRTRGCPESAKTRCELERRGERQRTGGVGNEAYLGGELGWDLGVLLVRLRIVVAEGARSETGEVNSGEFKRAILHHSGVPLTLCPRR